jgi:hypothetical protein
VGTLPGHEKLAPQDALSRMAFFCAVLRRFEISFGLDGEGCIYGAGSC